jgi:amylosucrase
MSTIVQTDTSPLKQPVRSAVVTRDSIFDMRWRRSFADLMDPLTRLYGSHPRFETALANLQDTLHRNWAARPDELRTLDLERDLNPDWFLSERMIGYVFYIDRFAGNLLGILDHLDHLEALGVTYVHFMPCLEPRPGDSDGGYSVKDYRAINPALGTMADFEIVATALRQRGMSVCVDLVLNHTAKEHDWAMRARAGETRFQDYYWMFDSAEQPQAYEKTLVEVFPETAPGSFTHYPDFDKWVWTTFNEHQWDLNWSNPDVFVEMVDIMLNLANRGAQVLRLDAVAFMWKRMGTDCQNQPEVHDILQALRAATRVAAPALIHKAEAIVSPRDLVPYLGTGAHTGREANLAYHNNVMVQFWSSLASRDTRLMTHVLRTHFPASFRNACWATYIRCHDDIGWAITDEDASALPHFSAPGHRRFLADYYEGVFAGSFARGAVFQGNPVTGDRRTSGSFASLAGLETALEAGDPAKVSLAVNRILMGHALIAAFGGVPLFYMGDEIGLMNDMGFGSVPEHAHDNRWMHRPVMDWALAQTAAVPGTAPGDILAGTRHIIERRKSIPAFCAVHPTRIVDLGHDRLFCFAREGDAETVVCVHNFTEHSQSVPDYVLRSAGVKRFRDLLARADVEIEDGAVYLPPYGRLWLV